MSARDALRHDRPHVHARRAGPIRGSRRSIHAALGDARTRRERRRGHRQLRARPIATSSRSSRRRRCSRSAPPDAAPAVRARRGGAAVPRRARSTPRSRSSPCTTGTTSSAGCAELRASRAARSSSASTPSSSDELLARRRLLPRDRRRSTTERTRARHRAASARSSTSQRVEPVPVPADCVDGFAACFWNRPEAYLDPDRAGRHLVLRAARSRRSARARHRAAARRSRSRARGTRGTAHLRALAELDRRLPAARRRRPDATLTADAAPRSPKGSLERATLQLFEDADLAVVRSSDVDYRADDRRSPRHRRHDPAAAGDPALRRRRPVRPRHHRPRLDRGDRRRRRDAHRSCTTRRRPPGRSGSCSRSPATRRGSRSTDLPAGVRVHTEYPGADARASSRSTASTPRSRSRTARPRRRSPRSPTRSSRSPRPAARCAPRACKVLDTILVSYTELIANPTRVRRRREAQGDGAAADAAHRRARSARPRAREAQRRRGEPRRPSSTCCPR